LIIRTSSFRRFHTEIAASVSLSKPDHKQFILTQLLQ
jgi:hypothetical protein